jgi:hypothetical protein
MLAPMRPRPIIASCILFSVSLDRSAAGGPGVATDSDDHSSSRAVVDRRDPAVVAIDAVDAHSRGSAGGRFTALDLDARIAEAVTHLEPRPRHR